MTLLASLNSLILCSFFTWLFLCLYFSFYLSCLSSTSPFPESPVLPLILMATLLSTSSSVPYPLFCILSFSPICPWSHAALQMGSCVRLAAIGYCLLCEPRAHPIMWGHRLELWCSSLPDAEIQWLWTNDSRQQSIVGRASLSEQSEIAKVWPKVEGKERGIWRNRVDE